MKCKLLLSICVGILFFSCTNKMYLKRIDTFFNASSVNDKSRLMSDRYRSYFMEKSETGKDKNAALLSFQNWDAPLHPQITILNYTINNNTWTIKFNEQNDFSKLIEFPGWNATEIVTFNSQKLIDQTIYIPDSTNPSYKKWLQPAIEWLKANKPDSLQQVYQNGRLVQNEATAREWIILLKGWRENKKK